jgi:hypothetical protein
VTDEIQSKVLAWMEAEKRGYKAAEKQFGIPSETIRSWAQAARAGRSLPRPNARTRARETVGAREAAVVADPRGDDTWDPTTCGREEWLTESIRRCLTAAATAQAQGHGGVARQWEVTAGSYRDELDHLREAARRQAEAQGRVGTATAAEMASRVLRALPGLVRIDRELAERVYLELRRELGHEP